MLQLYLELLEILHVHTQTSYGLLGKVAFIARHGSFRF